jgi:hypothetical protein
MIARAYIALFPHDDKLEGRREGARARAVLLKAGVHVPPHESACDVAGDIQAVMNTAQAVRGLVEQRKLGRLTTLVKLNVDPP